MVSRIDLSDQRIAGICLVISSTIFFIAVTIPAVTDLTVGVWSAPFAEQLALVAAHTTAWQAANLGMLVAAFINIAGIEGFASAAHGLRPAAKSGSLLFAAASILWIARLLLRLSVTVWAARALGEDSNAGGLLEPLHAWGSLMTDVYLPASYFGLALLGAGLLRPPIEKVWLGWVLLIGGVSGGISTIARIPSFLSIPAGVQMLVLVVAVGGVTSAKDGPPTLAALKGRRD